MITIREEQPSDSEAVTRVTQAAFANVPYRSGNEQSIVGALRSAGALTLSLVAESGGQVVGHVAFSPVTISDGSDGWYGLGPVSVTPALQRQGIGTALIREGLSFLQSLGAKGVVLLGDPNYYGRFGFTPKPGLVLEGVSPEYFLALPFGDEIPSGFVPYHPSLPDGF